MLFKFLQDRRDQQRVERSKAATESASRQAGTMTRGERDALRRKPVRVVGDISRGPYSVPSIPTHTNPAKHAARADRAARKAGRGQQRRGAK